MQVKIKQFDVQMDLKNNGIELEIKDNDGAFLGDLIVTKTGLIWCEGKTARKNGKKISHRVFRDYMVSQ